MTRRGVMCEVVPSIWTMGSRAALRIDALAGAGRRAGLDAVDAVDAEFLVGVVHQEIARLAAAVQGDAPFLLRDEKAEVRLRECEPGQPREVGGGGIGLLRAVEAAGVEEAGAVHVQVAREGVHLGDEAHRGRRRPAAPGCWPARPAAPVGAQQVASDQRGQRVGGDVVALEQGGVEQVAHADLVAGLEAAGVGGGTHIAGDRRGFVERVSAQAHPVEHDDGRGDLRQAGDLELVNGVAAGEDVAGLVVHDDECLGGRSHHTGQAFARGRHPPRRKPRPSLPQRTRGCAGWKLRKFARPSLACRTRCATFKSQPFVASPPTVWGTRFRRAGTAARPSIRR